MAGAMLKPNRAQHFPRPDINFCRFMLTNQQWHRDVFQRGKIGQQVVKLIDKAQFAVA